MQTQTVILVTCTAFENGFRLKTVCLWFLSQYRNTVIISSDHLWTRYLCSLSFFFFFWTNGNSFNFAYWFFFDVFYAARNNFHSTSYNFVYIHLLSTDYYESFSHNFVLSSLCHTGLRITGTREILSVRSLKFLLILYSLV